MKEKVFSCSVICILTVLFVVMGGHAWADDVRWMREGVRVWYLGGVDGEGATSSNAEEAYTLGAVAGGNIPVTKHAALTHWTSPQAPTTTAYPRAGMGPCWIHPLVLDTLVAGNYWMGQEITLVTRSSYTYGTFPYKLLPTQALFNLKSPREIVKLSYMIDSSVGNAYFDSETGLLLYYHTLWGSNKMFFILSEINYNFATRRAFAEDDGPHTGFKSLTSEQSMWGGSVVIQSLVETRYGNIIEMRVLASTSGGGGSGSGDLNYCYFGDVPIVRYKDATVAPSYPPEQWDPYGEYLWWWIPPAALTKPSISVLAVPMTPAGSPNPFTATQSPSRLYFSHLWFGGDGYMTQFSAVDTTISLNVAPGQYLFQNSTTVYGLSYYRNTMGLAIPVAAVTVAPSILAPLLFK